MKITVKSSTLVKPAKETPKCILWNSNVDLVIPRIHIPTVYFYKGNCNDANAFNCSHLKNALGSALVPFYPMAGRLKDKGMGRLDINCNGDGVLFVEADAEGCISEYGEYFPPCMKMRRLIPQVDYSKDCSSFPLLVIQVTFFKCGGVAIGTGVHHHVADGLGALWFLNYWADTARGIEKEVNPFFDRTLLRARDPPRPKFPHVEYQPPPPLLNAKVEYFRKGHGIIEMCNNYAIASNEFVSNNGDIMEANGDVNIAESDHLKVITNSVQANGYDVETYGIYRKENGEFTNGIAKNVDQITHLDNGDLRKSNVDCPHSVAHSISVNGSNPFPESFCNEEVSVQRHQSDIKLIGTMEDDPDMEYYGPISAELFIFSQEQVESLKARAAEHAVAGDRPVSSYEVLAAHIWRCVSLARGLQDDQLTKLYIATDGRSRLQPPLPDNYFGNVIFTAAPVMQVGQLVGGPLAAAAMHIRQTVQVMDDDYLRSALDFLQLQPNLADFSRGAHTFKTPNLGITSWVRLPIYGADFGWGPPLSMAPAGVPFEGLAYLLPGPPDDKRMRLSITLTPDHMRHFQELIYQI